MKSETFTASQELSREEEQFETQENTRSSEEVAELVMAESEDLVSNGEDEYEELMYGLSESDPEVVSFREQLTNIAVRAREVSKWASASLALSLAQPAIAQESVLQQVTSPQVESGQSYELQYDNPQRAAYSTPAGYREYLKNGWEKIRSLADIEKDRADRSREALKTYFRTVNEDGSVRGLTEEEIRGLEQSGTPGVSELLEKFNQSRKNASPDLDEEETFLKTLDLPDAEIEEQLKDPREAFLVSDIQRQWLAEVTHSPEYRRRLLDNEGLTAEDVAERERRVVQDVLQVEDRQHVMYGNNLGEWHPVTQRVTMPQGEAINIGSTTAVHEFQHHVTKGGETMSKRAIESYKTALNMEEIERKIVGSGIRNRAEALATFTNPTELDSRKKEFEYEFEKLTDWRYGEPFTPERLQQAKDLLREGKFEDGTDFLKMIKEDRLIELMNTLAQSEPVQRMGSAERQENA